MEATVCFNIILHLLLLLFQMNALRDMRNIVVAIVEPKAADQDKDKDKADVGYFKTG